MSSNNYEEKVDSLGVAKIEAVYPYMTFRPYWVLKLQVRTYCTREVPGAHNDVDKRKRVGAGSSHATD